MKRTARPVRHERSIRDSLRRRAKRFYLRFNRGEWEACYRMIDPRLTEGGKVDPHTYSLQLEDFKEAYGSIKPWHIRLSLHLDRAGNRQDERPFAYVYIVWQDASHGFHMFRERWVLDGGHWFTRVVGLLPNKPRQAAKGG